MIGKALVPCILFAAGGSAVQLLLAALGKDSLGAFCRDIVGLVILIFLVTSIAGQNPISFDATKNDIPDYQSIYNQSLQGIVMDTEAQTAEKICTVIEKEFGVRPKFCSVQIQSDTFALVNIQVHFNAQTLISGYAVKKHLEEAYDTEVEVFFDG